MMTVVQFKEWLVDAFGDATLWERLIQPAMKHIVICTSKSAQVHNGTRFELGHVAATPCEVLGYKCL